MKGKMLCVIYCVLSKLTVVLFGTAVLWLHPDEGRAQIDAGGGGDGWRWECLVPSHPLPDVERGGSAPEGALGSQALCPQMFIDLYIQSFKKFIRKQTHGGCSSLPSIAGHAPQHGENSFCTVMVKRTYGLLWLSHEQ